MANVNVKTGLYILNNIKTVDAGKMCLIHK